MSCLLYRKRQQRDEREREIAIVVVLGEKQTMQV
jgi:hypothetical protein